MQLSLPAAVAKPLRAIGMVNLRAGFAEEGTSQVVIVQPTAVGSVIAFLQSLMWIFALLLMFQRNRGFNLGAFLAICYCTPCYLAYALADPKGKQKIGF